MVARTSLPLALLEALDNFERACQHLGYWVAEHNRASGGIGEPNQLRRWHDEVSKARATLMMTIENHATSLYEGGLELGRSEAVQ